MIQSFWEIKKLNPIREPFCRAGAGRSFVKHLPAMLYSKGSLLTSSGTDINGTSRTMQYNTSAQYDLFMGMAGGNEQTLHGVSTWRGSESHGIVLGTGVAAVAAGNYALATPIAHGTGSGQLLHWGGLIRDTETSGDYAWFDLSRIFENQSGDSIVVKELGIVALKYTTVSPYLHQFLICRDVLAEPAWITVADTEMLKVTYRIRVTV